MKVALVIDSLAKGGAERQALLSARVLAARGCDVELIRYFKEADEYEEGGCAPARAVLIEKRNRPLRFFVRLVRYLRRGKFDVVHAFKETPCIYGCLAAAVAGVPVRLAGYRAQVSPPGMARRMLQLVNRTASAWIPNSQGVAETLVEYLGVDRGRLHVIHNGIDVPAPASRLDRGEARRRLELPEDAPTVAMVAALRPEKNHGMFVRMADEVRHSIPNAQFLIVGDTGRSDDDAHARLRAMAEVCGVANRIHFLGQRSDIPDVLAAVDVSVLTSDHEGLSNALLESMAVGKAVVTTDYRGADEVVTHGVDGFITPRGDARAMGKCVSQLLTDVELRTRVGEQARRTVTERFSVDALADRLIAVYQQYLPGGEAHMQRPQDG